VAKTGSEQSNKLIYFASHYTHVIAVNNKKMRNPLDILMNKINLETRTKKTVVKTDIY